MKLKLLGTLFAACILMACSTIIKENSNNVDVKIYKDNVDECLFKNNKTPASNWIVGFPVGNCAISAVGYSESKFQNKATVVVGKILGVAKFLIVQLVVIIILQQIGSVFWSLLKEKKFEHSIERFKEKEKTAQNINSKE